MPRNNNFDLLRMLFASMVVLYHCHDLSLNTSYFWIPYVTSSGLAVEGFFAMSGCLIVGSYDRNPAIGSYLEKRARRLLPAYWAALLFTLILALFMSSLPVFALLRSPSTYKYILANLTFLSFLHPVLPGLFVHNPVLAAVNGALWTIKVEVMFYLLVPAIVACGRRFGHCETLSGIFLLSVGYRVLCSHLHHPLLAVQLPGQLCFFVIGSLTYYYYPWFQRCRHWMWTTALISYLLSVFLGWIAFRAIGVGLGVMCLGLLLPCMRGPTKYGDFSYGTYVFHFPVIQAFISRGIVNAVPNAALGLICLTTGCLAIASWYLVERPWLHPTPRKQPDRFIQSLGRLEAGRRFDTKET
jgi:peptidoglycan/LPS O-acetylase OafA/YrhL